MARKTPVSPKKPPAAEEVPFWRRNRRELTFLILFAVLLGAGFSLISLNWVNDHAIEPLTAGIARTSGAVLNLLGQKVTMAGTVIRSPRFAVNIRNGCNGVEAMLIFLAAVLAFPASWKSRLAGLRLGFIAIQVVNLSRGVVLFVAVVYFTMVFETSHTLSSQTFVIRCFVMFWT